MSSFWNERYSEAGFAYGDAPNVFFAEQLEELKVGAIILPCEGEGRNAVYAATKGWQVHAFDSSEAGKMKALQLANQHKVQLNYAIEDAATVTYPDQSVDAVAFIYAHFPPSIRTQIHQKAIDWLKPGGVIIVEAFNPKQLQNSSGGPKDITMLYTEIMLLEDFETLNTVLIET